MFRRQIINIRIQMAALTLCYVTMLLNSIFRINLISSMAFPPLRCTNRRFEYNFYSHHSCCLSPKLSSVALELSAEDLVYWFCREGIEGAFIWLGCIILLVDIPLATIANIPVLYTQNHTFYTSKYSYKQRGFPFLECYHEGLNLISHYVHSIYSNTTVHCSHLMCHFGVSCFG